MGQVLVRQEEPPICLLPFRTDNLVEPWLVVELVASEPLSGIVSMAALIVSCRRQGDKLCVCVGCVCVCVYTKDASGCCGGRSRGNQVETIAGGGGVGGFHLQRGWVPGLACREVCSGRGSCLLAPASWGPNPMCC